MLVEYPEAFHTASTSEMALEHGSVCSQTVVLDRTVNKQKKIMSAHVWIAVIFPFFCHLSCFCSGTIAKSQVDSLVFAPHPGEGDKPPGSQPAMFCVTANSCCTSPDSTKGQGCLLVKGEGGRAGQGTCVPEGPKDINAAHCWAICRLLHDLTDSQLLERSHTKSTAWA